jgi:hypothetical protein
MDMCAHRKLTSKARDIRVATCLEGKPRLCCAQMRLSLSVICCSVKPLVEEAN